jgi:peptidoglycan/xylan/chitin deacetylase (PgdA/CDA1 family)
MVHVRLLLAMVGLGMLSGCGGWNNPAPLPSHGVTGAVMLKETPLATDTALMADTGSAFPADKLIALTFDDGPRPYVLFGTKGVHPAPGLADILDQNGVKATFFVVGWRLTPKTWGEPRHEENVGVTCIDAAEQLTRRGHELEDHTFSHIELRSAEGKMGEQWVLRDVNRGALAIRAVTGVQPRYLRPPDWTISNDARRDLERQGYRVLTISGENPMALRDVNSLDYLCAGRDPIGCPKPSLEDAVLKQVEQREKRGIYTHILAFHELSSTAAVMPRLINDLKARGYHFVTLAEYMNLVASKPGEMLKIADDRNTTHRRKRLRN